MNVSNSDFDGFYFQPTGNDGVEFNYFLFNEEKDRGPKVDNSSMGDMYHIILWKSDEIGLPEIQDNYEAILIDPVFYARQVTESNSPSYGVILRKTTESFKFVESYLEKFENSVKTAIEKIEELKKSKQKKGWFKK
jgi:hypothetical protein